MRLPFSVVRELLGSARWSKEAVEHAGETFENRIAQLGAEAARHAEQYGRRTVAVEDVDAVIGGVDVPAVVAANRRLQHEKALLLLALQRAGGKNPLEHRIFKKRRT